MTTVDPKDRGRLARAWWSRLQPVDAEGIKLPGNRSALARLRRCSSPLEAATEPETAALFAKLGTHANDIGRVAVLASVLSHVREEPRPAPRIARAIGAPPGGDRTTRSSNLCGSRH
jgi:CRISPR system Cascade subunit CasB